MLKGFKECEESGFSTDLAVVIFSNHMYCMLVSMWMCIIIHFVGQRTVIAGTVCTTRKYSVVAFQNHHVKANKKKKILQVYYAGITVLCPLLRSFLLDACCLWPGSWLLPFN